MVIPRPIHRDLVPPNRVPYRRHGHTTVSRVKSEGALQQAAVTETGA